MNQHQQGWFANRRGEASTGLKMLFYLSLGLLPLGLIAILASMQSARDSRAQYAEDARSRLELKAERIDGALSKSMLMLRAASGAIGLQPNPRTCGATLERIAAAERLPGHYALFLNGAPRCITRGYDPATIAPRPGMPSTLEISPGSGTIRFAVFDPIGAVSGTGELTRDQLTALTSGPGTSERSDLALVGNTGRLVLHDNFAQGPLEAELALRAPIANGRLSLDMVTSAVRVTPAELLMMLLPVLMWLAAGLIGWLMVDRLLLRPLARMQRAVAAYQPGDRDFALPTSATPAREIGELGEAFVRVTQTVARHEAELEAGLQRQIRLVREVHHRVKNNLQVVASLLNLHARGATSPDASAAYASIQRRVDALAVVHRNHYAELEDNRGVALKSLLSELGANLRATAPPEAHNMQIRLLVEPVYATQDVAVSVAFLVTELVEFAMFCGAKAVTVTMEETSPTAASLTLESEALRGGVECDPKLAERVDRIVTGLSRQLRSAIDKDLDTGRYALDIAIVGREDG